MIEAKLIMFRANGDRRDLPLNGDRTLIGRQNDCDIRIPLTEVSRHHTELTIQDDTVQIKDLNSSNGTFVNNKRVKVGKLAPGDHVIVGPVVFTLQVNGEPTEIRPVKTKIKRRTDSAVPVVTDDSPLDAVVEDELDPISALEALASSADQTAIDPFEDEEL
ncbi:MAG: FHA domain-containing protein [Phycisphaerales bacterium]|nr:FHA domain-containing protein [Phycisphaerales bacterium]